jgi:septal ring factor EnvC (AmiA/AmiB activator)
MLVKVNNVEMVRDTESMALLNTNITEKNEYYAKVRMLKNQKDELNKVNTEISELKNEMNDIKSLLKQLIDRQ